MWVTGSEVHDVRFFARDQVLDQRIVSLEKRDIGRINDVMVARVTVPHDEPTLSSDLTRRLRDLVYWAKKHIALRVGHTVDSHEF